MSYAKYQEALGDEDKTLDFRNRIHPRTTFSDERQDLALGRAKIAQARGEYETAETWALRALHDGPSLDAFCLLGDVCQDTGDLKNAQSWYKLACACDEHRRYDEKGLVESRHVRLSAIRRQIREEWQNRVPVREINFKKEATTKIFVTGDASEAVVAVMKRAAVDTDLAFIAWAPNLILPHNPELPKSMWVLPVRDVPEFGNLLSLADDVEFQKWNPNAMFGAFTGWQPASLR